MPGALHIIYRNVSITVLTLAAECYPEERQDAAQVLINCLTQKDVCVQANSQVHEHFAVIDRHLIWYGGVNLLSREKSDESMIRIIDKELSNAILLKES